MTTEEQFKSYQKWAKLQDQAKEKGQKVRKQVAEQYEESGWLKFLAWVMLAGVVSALFVIAWLNIAPYVTMFQSLGKGENWISRFMSGGVFGVAIGGIVDAWGGFVLTIAGFLLWALTQTMQCLWLIVRMDRRSMKSAIHRARTTQVYAKDGDTAVTRRVIKRHNRVPYFFIRWSGLLSLGATAFDLVVNLGYYPPAKNFEDFVFALSTGMWNRIDSSNLTKLLVSVLLFELLLILAIVLWQWIRTSKSEVEEA